MSTATEPAPSFGKWIRADCAPRSGGVYCWYRSGFDPHEHYEYPACDEGCEAPATMRGNRKDLCETCWKRWFTEHWEN